MAKDDVILLGATNLQQRSRVTSSGVKHRYTVEVTGDTIGTNLDPKALGQGPAEAIAAHLKMRITSITAIAAKGTLAARKVAQRAFNNIKERKAASAAKKAKKAQQAKSGEAPKKAEKFSHPLKPPKYGPTKPSEGSTGAWVQQRYGGGRMGAMEPNQSDRLFNDSGRLAESIVAGPKGDGWVINVAANRFDPKTFPGGVAALTQMFERLAELVPEFADLGLLADSITVKRAIREATAAMMQKATGQRSDLRWSLFSRGLGVVRTLGRMVG